MVCWFMSICGSSIDLIVFKEFKEKRLSLPAYSLSYE